MYRNELNGHGVPPRPPYVCPSLRELADGTTCCNLFVEAQGDTMSGARPGGWDGLVARLLLIGDGCTAAERVRSGKLLRAVPPECARTLGVERRDP